MRTINEQLNIPTLPEGKQGFMPNLYNGNRLDADRGYNDPIIAGDVYRHADGGNWNNVIGDCAGITASTGIQGAAVCVSGRAVYIPAIWAALKLTQKGRDKIEHNRCVCLKRKEARKANDIPPVGGVVDNGSLDTRDTSALGTGSSSGSSTGSVTGSGGAKTGMSTGMKVGIGVGIVAVIGIAVWCFKFRKK